MRRQTAITIVAVYATFATLWILFSDSLMFRLWPEATVMYGFGMAKGLVFVGVTTLILYSLMRRLGQEEARRYRALLENHPAPMLLVDPGNGVIVDANVAAEALYGWPLARLRQMRITDISTQPADAVLAELARARQRRQDSFHVRHRTAGGERDVAVYTGPAEIGGRTLLVAIVQDVTERLRVEAALQASEARLKEAQRIAHIGSWDFDLVADRVAYSDEFYRILEVDPAAFGASYEAYLSVVHADDRELVKEVYGRAVAERLPYELVYRLQLAGRRVKYVHSRCETYYDEAGKPLRSLGTVQDISERQRAQMLLAFANEALARIARDEPLAATLAHIADGIETLAPEALCSILLLDADGAHLRHAAAPNLPAALCRAIDGGAIGPRAGSCGTAAYTGETVVTADIASDPLWTDYRGPALQHGLRACWSTPIRASSGGILGTFAVYYREARAPGGGERQLVDHATALAAIAIERARAGEALATAAQVVEASPVVLLRWRPEPGWPVEYVSENVARWGYRAADLLSGALPFADIVHADDLARVGEEVERYTREGRGEYTQTYRLLKADGTTMWIEDQTTVVRAADGRVLRYQGTVTDISERRQAEDEIRRLNLELEQRVRERTAELEDANRELESFSYSVSHDLRAPLRAISGFAQILARRHRQGLDAEGSHYLDNIVAAGERMATLIDDLLQYSRTGRRAVQAVAVDLAPIIDELRTTFAERIAAAGADFDVVEPLATPLGDATLIGQIITNLVDNALTYRRRDGRPRVTVAATQEGAYTLLRVADNGIGIAPDYQNKIFQVFQRLHSDEEYPGTGIGLAIVSKAVRLMGGEVSVESTAGEGSAFTVRLPAATPKPGASRS